MLRCRSSALSPKGNQTERSQKSSPGVVGTPDKGNFYYNAGETLDYSFSLEDGYVNLKLIPNNDPFWLKFREI